jgi:hypothetical protein
MTQVGQAKESSMAHLEKVLYTAKARTIGGREGGSRYRQHRRHTQRGLSRTWSGS